MNIKEQLIKIMQDNDLVNISYNLFWTNYNQYIIEDFDEAIQNGLINSTSVTINLDSVSYKLFKNEYELLVIRINIYNNIGKYLGYYDACFNLNGTFEDDFFVIE